MVEKHHTVFEREVNGVQYLRVEDGDLAQLGKEVVEEYYHLQDDNGMGMFTDGFEFH